MTLLAPFLYLWLSIMVAGLSDPSREGLKDGDVSPTVHRSTSNKSDWSQDTEAGKSVRLTKGTSACRGVAELRHNGRWRPLCQESLVEVTVSVLCRMLGCGSGLSWARAQEDGEEFPNSSNATKTSIAAAAIPNRTARYFLWLQCVHPESTLDECSVSQKQCHSGRLAELSCTAGRGVRLVGGPSRCAGRVEIEDPASGSWGTVCDDSWDLPEGHVVCRQLGCGYAVSTFGQAHFGMGHGLIYLDELNCSGSEASLWGCPADLTTDCGHKEDAGVVCSDYSELMSTVPATEYSSFTKTSSNVKFTGFLEPAKDEGASHQSRSLLILCVFLALMLLATLLGCGFIIFTMRRKHFMTSQEPRVTSLMRQGAPVLLSHSRQVPVQPTAIDIADRNLYQDSHTIAPKPQVPTAEAHPALGKDADSDYEDYDFRTQTPKALSSFHNSVRYQPIEESAPPNMAQMATLRGGTGTETPTTPTENMGEVADTVPRRCSRKEGDALSISSEEDHGISSSRMKSCSNSFPYQTNGEVPPVPAKSNCTRAQLPSSGSPGLQNPASSCVELEKDPKLKRSSARKSVASRPLRSPTFLKHYSQATDNSSSTSSGEEDWYQNWKPPQPTSQRMIAQPFSGDPDAATCSQEASSNWL